MNIKNVVALDKQQVRKFTAVLALLLCLAFSAHAQRTRFGQTPEEHNPADFAVDVHISASHIRYYCTGFRDQISCGNGLFADVIVSGKKFELSGATTIGKNKSALLVPGDYKARLTKNVKDNDGAVISQEYDVLLSNGATWHCVVTGISE